MSKLLLEVRTPDLHPPQQVPALPDSPPLSLVDRASLRLGLWLLLHSTRRVNRHADRDARARLVANQNARVVREHATLRMHQLQPRP